MMYSVGDYKVTPSHRPLSPKKDETPEAKIARLEEQVAKLMEKHDALAELVIKKQNEFEQAVLNTRVR